MQVRSSMTMTAPEPAIEPAAAMASKSSLVSSWSGMRTAADEPPGMMHLMLRPSVAPPPQPSMRSRSESVSGSS